MRLRNEEDDLVACSTELEDDLVACSTALEDDIVACSTALEDDIVVCSTALVDDIVVCSIAFSTAYQVGHQRIPKCCIASLLWRPGDIKSQIGHVIWGSFY